MGKVLGSFSGIGNRQTSVLLIDMQEEFTNTADSKILSRLIEAQLEVIKACAKKNWPLFVIEYRGYGQTINRLIRETKRVPRVFRITKDINDAFPETDLNATLKELFAKSLIVMGINANHCVRSTTISAIGHGFKVATTPKLIANFCECRSDEPETFPWYRENGILRD